MSRIYVVQSNQEVPSVDPNEETQAEPLLCLAAHLLLLLLFDIV